LRATVVRITVQVSISWQMARDGHLRRWKTTIGITRDLDINTLCVELDGGAHVECVPFPTQDAVVTRWQVRWDQHVHIFLVLIFAGWQVGNLEPLLLSVCLVGIISDVHSTVANVSSGQFPLHCDRLSSSELDPFVT